MPKMSYNDKPCIDIPTRARSYAMQKIADSWEQEE